MTNNKNKIILAKTERLVYNDMVKCKKSMLLSPDFKCDILRKAEK